MDDIQLKIENAIANIPAASWNQLERFDNPFLSWTWLNGFEANACTGARKGWHPMHLTLWRGPQLIAACPTYLKGDSMGEFVFDQEWAAFARSLGIQYYPKVLVAVPFTPASGPRFLTEPNDDRPQLIRILAAALVQVTQQSKYSSVHINFCREDESEALRELGFLERHSVQFHWENQNYASFDDYLGALKSKRRKQIKRERRLLAEAGVSFRHISGDQITPDIMSQSFQFYRDHVERFHWGRLYLSEDFFQYIGTHFKDHLHLVFAEKDQEAIGWAMLVEGGGTLYGRYWGHRGPKQDYLHFATCYYEGISRCISAGLNSFEPGAGGEFKRLRGFEPVITTSFHYLVDERMHQAVGNFLQQEARMVGNYRDTLLEHSQFRDDAYSPSPCGKPSN